MSKDYLKKSIFTLLSQVLLVVLGMANGILVARILGPTLKGQASLLLNAVQMLFMIGGLGLGSSFAYFVARKSYDVGTVIWMAIISSGILGGLSTLLFIVSLPLHKGVWAGMSQTLLITVSLLTMLYLLNNFLGRIISAQDKIYSYNIIDVCKSAVDLMTVVILIGVFGLGLKGYVVSLCLVAVFQLFIFAFSLKESFRPRISVGRIMVGEALTYGMKSYALLLVNFLNYRIDLFLLKYFRSDAEVGYYSLAVGMAELLWMVPNSTVAPLFNRIAGSESVDRSTLTVRTCRWSLYFLLVVAVVAIFWGKFFIGLLYGHEYLPSYAPFICLLPGICLFPIYKLLVVDLAARGMPGYGTITSIVALVTNVGANIFLIPRYGTTGAAFSSSVSYALMSVLSLIFFVRLTKLSLKELFIPDPSERELVASVLKFAVARSK